MHTAEYSDISIALSQFLLKLSGVWMTMNNAEERRRIFAMVYTLVIHIFGLYLNLGDVYHSRDNLGVSMKLNHSCKLTVFT